MAGSGNGAGSKGEKIRNLATLLAAASLATITFGAAACGSDDASGPPAAHTSGGPPAAGTSTAPSSPVPSAATSSPSEETSRPTVTGSEIIMIDPEGKKYSRKEMIQMAAGMAATMEKQGVPSNFCAMSYKEGVEGGGKFPAGKLAFMEACQEGVRLAG